MTAFSMLHLSDTHLSDRFDHFRRNNELMLDVLQKSDHDLIIHTGDITLDGIRHEKDFQFCQSFYGDLSREIHYIPGNHDVGDNPRLGRPQSENGSAISQERMERYLAYYGTDRWTIDRASWRMVGINSLLVGTGLPREQEQEEWVRNVLENVGDRHLALFTHQPFFVDEPDPIELSYWTVDPEGRESLRFLMEHPNLKVIASGHLHQQRARRFGSVELIWCPSVAFTTREQLVPEMGGQRQVGYLEHVFHDDGSVATQVRTHPDFQNSHLDDCIGVVYPFA
ncbi:metallophosphoesterase family protein [Pseudohoeflea coraliihabitans]|uniref:Metallophosphoesterase n=1 Tax=Pseudohoeflea coraliihabitans TaxID=2860393 RepID=A0ABS6WMR8_9HYPH|nr:metallophosphoesterase [Pseudohoeflea sp. DP4N28-3]MBW3097180.1 metallophosphoesterase [Pseudohoeflea sp. DP4N28-3]